MSFKVNIRGWVNSLIFVLLLLILPFVLWKGCSREKDLNERGKIGEGLVVDIKGVKKNKIVFHYTIGGRVYEKVRDARSSDYRIAVGEKIMILYDSLDFENVKIVWKKNSLK